MQISLRPEQREFVVESEVHLDELTKEIEGLVRLDPVHVKATVSRLSPDLYQVQAEQTTQATFSCSRCLTHYQIPITTTWTEQFSSRASNEEEEIHSIEQQKIDALPWIRESLLLELPYIPLCEEDYQGLCSTCGTNRNLQTCDCETEKIDPRLEKLQELFHD